LADDVATTVQMFDWSGRLVSTGFEYNHDVVEIRTNACLPGLYIVKVLGAKGTYTAKLIKE
jgi:hypothetical protein